MQDTKTQLQEAIETGEILTVIYHGGSQPGKSRQISPMKIKDNIVTAKALPDTRPKSFLISKIEIADSVSTKITYSQENAQQFTKEPSSLYEGVKEYIHIFENLGWHIKVSDEEIGLYRLYKNGNQRKTPDVLIGFQEFTYYEEYSEEKANFVYHKKLSVRPWHVSSKQLNKNTSYKYLSKAMRTFVEFSHSSAKGLKL